MSRKHEKYERLIAYCKALPPVPTAVAYPCDQTSLQGAIDAKKLGLIEPVLFGPEARIKAEAAKHSIDLSGVTIVDVPGPPDAAADAAVALAREGKAEALMKGSLHT